MNLLETNDIDLSGAWSWFHEEAEIFVIALTLSYHIGGHRHALNVLNSPVLFFFFDLAVVLLIVVVIVIIVVVIHISFLLFLLAEESLRNLQLYIDQTFEVIGPVEESYRAFRNVDMCPFIFLQLIYLCSLVMWCKIIDIFDLKVHIIFIY